MGVTVLQHTAVETVTPAGAKWSIQTPDHSLDNDHAVIALGAATNALLTPLGIQLPIIGALSPYQFATGHARQPAVHRPGFPVTAASTLPPVTACWVSPHPEACHS